MLLARVRSEFLSSYGTHQTTNTNVFGNTFWVRTPNDKVGGATEAGPQMFTPTGTNRFHDNTWHLPSATANPYRWNGGRYTKDGWRGQNQDMTGAFVL
jgi:hypothetical protein